MFAVSLSLTEDVLNEPLSSLHATGEVESRQSLRTSRTVSKVASVEIVHVPVRGGTKLKILSDPVNVRAGTHDIASFWPVMSVLT